MTRLWGDSHSNCRVGFSFQTDSRPPHQGLQASSGSFSVYQWGQVCPCVLSHSAVWCSACICRRSPRLSCRSWSCRPGTVSGCAGSWFGQWRSATPGRHGGSSTSHCDPHHQSSWAAGGLADTLRHTPAPWWDSHWCTDHQRCILWTSAPCSPPGSGLGLRHENSVTYVHVPFHSILF